MLVLDERSCCCQTCTLSLPYNSHLRQYDLAMCCAGQAHDYSFGQRSWRAVEASVPSLAPARSEQWFAYPDRVPKEQLGFGQRGNLVPSHHEALEQSANLGKHRSPDGPLDWRAEEDERSACHTREL